MARYVLRARALSSHPNHGPPQLLGTGTRIADAASALPGDVVCDTPTRVRPFASDAGFGSICSGADPRLAPSIDNHYYLTIA